WGARRPRRNRTSQLERLGQQLRRSARDDLPIRVLERDAVEAELVDPLPTPAAGRRGDRDLLEVARAATRNDRASDRGPFRADAERIRGVLDVHTLEEPP